MPSELEVQLGGGDPRAHAAPGDAQIRIERHGSDDEPPPARPRVHRPRAGAQVRRVLPRPCRLLPRARRIGGRDAGNPRAARAYRASWPRSPSPLHSTTSARPRRPPGNSPANWPRSSSSRSSGTPASSRRTADFLPGLRALADRDGALLIFDEVMTGFRIAPGGARERFGVTPDLTALGKVIGGGLPVAAFGGRRNIMELVAPSGPVYQAGTLSGQPARDGRRARDASLADARAARSHRRRTGELVDGLRRIAARHGVPFSADHAGSMWGFSFRARPPRSFADAQEADIGLFRRVFHAARARGLSFAPSAYRGGVHVRGTRYARSRGNTRAV